MPRRIRPTIRRRLFLARRSRPGSCIFRPTFHPTSN